MTGTIIRTNDNTNVVFEWEGLSALPEQTVEDAAYEQWERGAVKGKEDSGIDFEDLEEQDHLDIMDAYLKRVTLDMAAAGVQRKTANEAREAADLLIQERHGLGSEEEDED